MCHRSRRRVLRSGVAAGLTGVTGCASGFGSGAERWRVETRAVLFDDYRRVGINVSPAVATAPGDVYGIHGR